MGFLDKVADVKHRDSDDPQELLDRGLMYYNAEEYSDAAEWFRKAAELGNAEAQNNMGYLYDNGMGVPELEGEAIGWYSKAAEQGHIPAMINLALCYYSGKEEYRDYEKAYRWFKSAYDLGDTDAAFFLGQCYAYGQGTEKDPEKALEILTVASDNAPEYTEFPEDLYQAPLLIAELYDSDDLGKDEDKAAEWYEVAADRGSDEAVDRHVEMGRREKKKGFLDRFRH